MDDLGVPPFQETLIFQELLLEWYRGSPVHGLTTIEGTPQSSHRRHRPARLEGCNSVDNGFNGDLARRPGKSCGAFWRDGGMQMEGGTNPSYVCRLITLITAPKCG